MFELLLEEGVSIFEKDRFGWTPLHHAASGDAIAVAMKLVDLGADLVLEEMSAWDKFTPLYYAAKYNAKRVAKFLIDSGANIHSKGQAGKVTLDSTAKYIPVLLSLFLPTI